MNATIKNLLVLFFFSALTFSFSNYLLNGSLSDTSYLSSELKSLPDSLYEWKIGNEVPFKYRMLHRAIVGGTYSLLKGNTDNNTLFFSIYRTYAFLFQTLAIILFYYFLVKIKLEKYALAGAILFSLLPAFLMAYNLPVHTREDMLGYSLLFVGLGCIVSNQALPLLVVSILGVLCRETLLIIPFVNFFFNARQSWVWRFVIASAAGATLILLRLSYGLGDYDYLEGFKWNMSNMEQVIGFSYITFGALWIPFLASLIQKRNSKLEQEPVNLMYKSAISVLLLVLVTTFMGAIFNEIRILYLLAPWVITINLHYYATHKEEIQAFLQSGKYRLIMLAMFGAMAVLTFYILNNVMQYIEPSRYAISYTPWIIVSVIQIYLGIICMPIVISIQMKKK